VELVAVGRTGSAAAEQFRQDPVGRCAGRPRVPLGRQGPLTYRGRDVLSEVEGEVGGRIQGWDLPVTAGERPPESFAGVVATPGRIHPVQVMRPKRHPEVRGPLPGGRRVHDRLAV
jgi:hypothetical protein